MQHTCPYSDASQSHMEHINASAGCSTSHDAFKGIQLPSARPSVGLAAAHGHHTLLYGTARVPAEAQQVFTTLHDGQDTVRADITHCWFGTACSWHSPTTGAR